MARVENGSISGAVGNLIFYTMNGNGYVRSKPGKRPRKRNHKPLEVNTVFGTVSTCGSPMLVQLGRQLLYTLKLADYNRTRGWMRNQYANNYQATSWPIAAHTGGTCQVNGSADLRDCLFVDTSLQLDKKKLTLGLPALNPAKQIKAPPRTSKVTIKAMVISSPFKMEAAKNCTVIMEQLVIDYKDMQLPATELVLNLQGKGVAIVALALEYTITASGKELVEMETKWLPAALIAMGRF